MNKLLICFLFILSFSKAFSQRVYFIYLQTEQEQPFFVRMNEKVYSSTGSGYLILSKLRDSSYSFSVGFPQNKWPEQNFTIPVKSKDHGFLLKNFGEKGWGLYDLQTSSVQMASTGTAKTETPKNENKDVSPFTEILSKASDDPTLKERPVQPKVDTMVRQVVNIEQPKTETKEPVIKMDPSIVKKDEPKTEPKDTVITTPSIVKTTEVKTEIKDQPVIKTDERVKEQPIVTEEPKPIVEEPYKRSVVTRRSESSTTEGFGLVFIDDLQNGTVDTIRLLIPNPKPVVKPVKEEPKQEPKFLDISSDTTAAKKVITDSTLPVTRVEPILETKDTAAAITPKNNCAAQADQNDFFQLRKQMAAIETDDDMISAARKYFKNKCFTVAQIKNLSTLFLEESGKYKFFDAAYPHASDQENFASLQSELKDPYYINRFKAMLK